MHPIEKLKSWPGYLYSFVKRRFFGFQKLIFARITYQIPTFINSIISDRQWILQYPPVILHRFARVLDLCRLSGVTTSGYYAAFLLPLSRPSSLNPFS